MLHLLKPSTAGGGINTEYIKKFEGTKQKHQHLPVGTRTCWICKSPLVTAVPHINRDSVWPRPTVISNDLDNIPHQHKLMHIKQWYWSCQCQQPPNISSQQCCKLNNGELMNWKLILGFISFTKISNCQWKFEKWSVLTFTAQFQVSRCASNVLKCKM